MCLQYYYYGRTGDLVKYCKTLCLFKRHRHRRLNINGFIGSDGHCLPAAVKRTLMNLSGRKQTYYTLCPIVLETRQISNKTFSSGRLFYFFSNVSRRR